jgi:hypothetical protein
MFASERLVCIRTSRFLSSSDHRTPTSTDMIRRLFEGERLSGLS